jgi:hypothetical protein
MVSAICWNNIVLFPVKYIPNAPTITELNEKLRKASNDNLGMTRNTNESIDNDKMIQTGRQTLHNLFGAGLHGRNGLNPKIAKHIWSTYVIPRLIFGLEIQLVIDTQIQKLNQFQIKSLKQLQWLPSRCSNATVYLLLGAEPIQATINKRMLSLFGQIIRDQNSVENKIAYRQIVIYDLNSKSWFSKLKMVLMKYGLPEAFHLLQNPPKKTRMENYGRQESESILDRLSGRG